jgi:hypothetical protein
MNKDHNKYEKINKENPKNISNELTKLKQGFYGKLFQEVKNLFSEDYTLDKFIHEYRDKIDSLCDYTNKSLSFVQIRDMVLKSLDNNKTHKNEKIKFENFNKTENKSKLIIGLEKRKNSEWALITKIETDKYLKQKQLKEIEAQRSKTQFKNLLHDQIEDKKQQESKRKKEELERDKLILQMNESNMNIDDKRKKEKNERDKFYWESIFSVNQKNILIKNENLQKLKEEEKIFEQDLKLKNEIAFKTQQEIFKRKQESQKEINEYIRNQIIMKENEKAKKHQAKREEKEKLDKLNESILKTENEKSQYLRVSKENYKNILDSQIESKSEWPTMTESEKKINRKYFEN